MRQSALRISFINAITKLISTRKLREFGEDSRDKPRSKIRKSHIKNREYLKEKKNF